MTFDFGYCNVVTKYLEKYLHQQIVDMFPDYGCALFWDEEGASIAIDDLKYIKEDSALYKELETFNIESLKALECVSFECENGLKFNNSFYKDVDELDIHGKKLYQEVQEIVKEKFIIVYMQSFEEGYYRKKIAQYSEF